MGHLQLAMPTYASSSAPPLMRYVVCMLLCTGHLQNQVQNKLAHGHAFRGHETSNAPPFTCSSLYCTSASMTTPAWSDGFRSGDRSTSKVLRLLVGLRAHEVDFRDPSPMIGLSSTSNCTLLRLARGAPARHPCRSTKLGYMQDVLRVVTGR